MTSYFPVNVRYLNYFISHNFSANSFIFVESIIECAIETLVGQE